MRKIYIDKQVINIPETWDDLTQEQYVFIASLLYRHHIGEIDFSEVQLLSVCKILNLQVQQVKEKISLTSFINYLLASWKLNFTRIYRRIYREDYIAWRAAARECYLSKEVKEDLLAFNLVQIAKELDFLQMDNFQISFLQNPVPRLPEIGVGKKFDIGILINTDITAGTYADAMDLMIAWEENKNPKDAILNYIIGMLYTGLPLKEILDNTKLLNSLDKVEFSVKYAIYLWFVSISTYFLVHPVYSHLYKGKKQDEDKIRLGMAESIIRLSKAGYGSVDNMKSMNLIAFMDIQIAELQESIRGALAAGIEPIKLAEKTGRTLTQIDQLS